MYVCVCVCVCVLCVRAAHPSSVGVGGQRNVNVDRHGVVGRRLDLLGCLSRYTFVTAALHSPEKKPAQTNPAQPNQI